MTYEKHEFGPGVLPELSTKLYKNPLAAIREAISNSFDAMSPYEKKGIKPMIEIYTNDIAHGDIIIEDWGTGIENYQNFKTISLGEKQVKDQISSYEQVNEKIIGQKGMGKLSFLSLSNERKVEFFSNNEQLGMHIVMTIDGFTVEYKDSQLILPHRGLKVVIKKAKHISEARLTDMLSRTFPLRLADGAKVLVNGKQVHKPEGFDSQQYALFNLKNGISVYGNLKKEEKPKLFSNVGIFVKRVFVEEKDFDLKVEGWVACDHLELRTDRDGLLEGNELYVEFYKKLVDHLEAKFEKKSERTENERISKKTEKEIGKMFVDVLKEIFDHDPNLSNPMMSGNIRDEQGIGSKSSLQGGTESHCTVQEGLIVNPTKTAELITAKPIGPGKRDITCLSRNGESTARITEGPGKILAPTGLLLAGNDTIPNLRVVVVGSEEKPPVYFSQPNRLVINSKRPSSKKIILDNIADTKDLKPRVLPFLVRAGIDVFPQSSEMTKDDYWKRYDRILDSMCSK